MSEKASIETAETEYTETGDGRSEGAIGGEHRSAEEHAVLPLEISGPAVIVEEATAHSPHGEDAVAAVETATVAEPSTQPASEPDAATETPSEPVADNSGLELASTPFPGTPPAAAEPVDHPAHSPSEERAHAAPTGEAALTATGEGSDAAADEPERVGAQVSKDDPAIVARKRTGDDQTETEDDEADDEDATSEDEDDEDDEDEDEDGDGETQIEQIGGDAMEEMPSRPMRPRRHYKIQEVIKRRQVLLVQVVKEERGTKGAALTTYLSLAGRYSVLMPNTARGGGISRKITDSTDRKRLKSIADELEVPEGMGIILRTAGASRTKAEVKRDFEYLLRMWETVREVTLQSSAPTLVYEEGSLIKRAIRDLYNKDVEEILVAGEDGYREAKDFMRLLMPSHAKNVQHYKDPQPIFAFAGAESQLDGMYFNQVTLRSGGYIVINQTEALVAIDVNSGRSTREHNIEDTALRTNLEAADEVARQLRLRDLAGLIVVDFIDMDEGRNNRAVERRMKDALKNDRARIQIGRISHFGLLEMSRQRIRTGVLEGSTVPCSHCMGTGMVRSTSSIALHVLRGLEEALIKNPNYDVTVRTRTEVALYILNQKRSHLRELEERFGVTITLTADASLSGVSYFAIERGELSTQRTEARPAGDLVRIDSVRPVYDDEAEDGADAEDAEGDGDGDGEEDEEQAEGEDVIASRDAEAGQDGEAGERDEGRGRGRRRRRRRGGRDRGGLSPPEPDAPQPSDDGLAVVMEISGDRPSARREPAAENGEEGEAPESGEFDAAGEPIVRGSSTTRRRRRSRRGGDGRRPYQRDHVGDPAVTEATADEGASGEAADGPDDAQFAGAELAPAPVPPPDSAAFEAATAEEQGEDDARPVEGSHAEPVSMPANDSAPEAPTALRDGDQTPIAAPAAASPEPGDADRSSPHAAQPGSETPSEPSADEAPAEEEPLRPKRSGWWQRAKATFGG